MFIEINIFVRSYIESLMATNWPVNTMLVLERIFLLQRSKMSFIVLEYAF